MFVSNIGQRIKKARTEMGLTQAQLAERCGWAKEDSTGQNRISMYENSKRTTRIKLQDIEALAAALEVTPAWILFNGAYSKLSGPRQKLHQTIGRIPDEFIGKADLVLQVFVEDETTGSDGHRAGKTSSKAKL